MCGYKQCISLAAQRTSSEENSLLKHASRPKLAAMRRVEGPSYVCVYWGRATMSLTSLTQDLLHGGARPNSRSSLVAARVHEQLSSRSTGRATKATALPNRPPLHWRLAARPQAVPYQRFSFTRISIEMWTECLLTFILDALEGANIGCTHNLLFNILWCTRPYK